MLRKFILLCLSGILLPFAAFSQTGIDQIINQKLQPIAEAIFHTVMTAIPLGNGLSIPIVLIILIGGALYFTIYFRFPNFTHFWLAINIVRGKHSPAVTSSQAANISEGDDPRTVRVEGDGEVSHFQALTAALSATVGLGNISSVAIAIVAGGPGATFWMILAGLLGMASKFTECTLGVKYREVGEDGTVYGGPMYYLSKGLKQKGMARMGKFFGIFYAIMLVGGSFGGGNMFQSNQAAAQCLALFGAEQSGAGGFLFGLVVAGLVAIVIIGGIKRIAAVTEKIVPYMVAIYTAAALIIILAHYHLIFDAFALIIDGALRPEAMLGGFIGVLIVGFQRAAFSNEAGVGSASVAHAAVRTEYPASEGIVALLEPFIDTVIVCTLTALVIIITNIEGGLVAYGDTTGLNGVNLTSASFESVLPGFSYILTVAIILFAFSTMISWSYYGLQAWKFLFGRSRKMDLLYKALFCFFVVIGAAMSMGAVVLFSDAMIFAMIFPNMIGLVFLAPEVKEELERYLKVLRDD